MEREMNNYSKCLNCQSASIIPDLSLEDAGAYPSHSHKVVSDTGVTSKLKAEVFGKKGGASKVRAYVCADCGFTALFVQDAKQLAGS